MTVNYETLPVTVVANPGTTVGLRDILTNAFGPSLGDYKDFYVVYEGSDFMNQYNFSYWDPAHPSVTSWSLNGQDLGSNPHWHWAADGSETLNIEFTWRVLSHTFNNSHIGHVTAADVDNVQLHVGNNIGPLAYILAPTAYDANGKPTDFVQYSVTTVESGLENPNTYKGAPTPYDVLTAIGRYAALHPDSANNNDCGFIAQDIAAAAGAPLSDLSSSLTPAQNESEGFWRVVYRGDSTTTPTANWSTLVQPGDIVRMGWTGGGQHTTMITGLNADGSMQVFDNIAYDAAGTEIIGYHSATYDKDTMANTITIFRLSDDHMNLVAGTAASETLSGTVYNDEMQASAGSDTLRGQAGDDVFDIAIGGIDKVDGGIGSDTISFANFTSALTIDLATGYHSFSTYYPHYIYRGSISWSNVENVTGGSGSDTLYGNEGANVIDGGPGGDDTLYGRGGNDTFLVSRYGNDKVIGGAGSDTLSFETSTVGVSIDLETGGQRFSMIRPIIGVVRLGSVSFSEIENVTGGSGDDTLRGTEGANVIDGRGGTNTLDGRGGNDTFLLSRYAHNTVTGGAGNDTLSYATDNLGVTIDLETGHQSFRGLARIGGYVGSVDFTGIENVTGGNGSDHLYGDANGNVLDGAAGTNTLDGRGGNDTFMLTRYAHNTVTGGAGSDTMSFAKDSIGVTIDLAAGHQTFYSLFRHYTVGSVDFTGVENVIGSRAADHLTGDAGANTLNGGLGADVMAGRTGNDIYYVDNAGDVVTEAANAGSDRVLTSISYGLKAGQSIEMLTTTNAAGTSGLYLTGNELGQSIFGNAGANVINGKGGKDVLTGLGGNDTFLFNTALNSTTNIDRITDFSHGHDKIALENAIFTKLTATGPLSAGEFFIGSHAHDADDHIIYNSTTGALVYDANGSAAGGAIQFATLAHGLALTHLDFVVV